MDRQTIADRVLCEMRKPQGASNQWLHGLCEGVQLANSALPVDQQRAREGVSLLFWDAVDDARHTVEEDNRAKLVRSSNWANAHESLR